jgi:hypothetical protein
MTIKKYIEKLDKLAMIPISELSDYKKLTEEHCSYIGKIQADIFNNINEYKDLKESNINTKTNNNV